MLAAMAALWPAPGGAGAATAALPTAQAEAAAERGRVTGLPVPRYVSLKASRANVRRGPGTDFPIDWVYTKRGVPLEVTAESNHWRRIRDHEGDGGWIWHTLLDGTRSAIVTGDAAADDAPADTPVALHDAPAPDADVVAYLEPGLVAGLRGCKAGWCRLEVQGRNGWAPQDRLWGVYPGEEFD
ncbi:SH3 domain-containing protein [uncultured Parvibaculum sp.]|uniref:SH3 domain-containing protein n=1 Tax=uncultured Parvibaculum sp. TaxID=291828 RepID=UPI0030D7904F